MRIKRISWILAVAVCLAVLCPAWSAEDPVVSLSYLNKTLKPELADAVSRQIANMFLNTGEITSVGEDVSRDGVIDSVATRVLEKLQMQGYAMYSTQMPKLVLLHKDDVLSGLAGTKLLMTSGSASVINAPIVNITGGVEIPAKSAVAQNTRYLIPTGNGAGIRITSDNAYVYVDGVYRVVSLRYRAKYFDLADALREMDLFRGSNIGYELSRSATRTEAVVMLLRLLGEEDAALAYSGTHPFTDVDAWADRYIAYAYSKGYTRGVAETKFGSKSATTADHYMTFILRVLGYDDTKGDFKWDEAMEFALSKEYLTQNELAQIASDGFHRDQMVYLSYYALFWDGKNGDSILNQLAKAGVVSHGTATTAIEKVSRSRL